MAPLSRTRRKVFFALLTAIFAALAPILIGYARGYRFSDLGDALRLIRTGGVYVAAGESGVTVSVDGEPRETTSFISRNALVQNLFAGGYHVEVSKPGHQTWAKDLQVYPELVTEWHPALVPEPVPLVEIFATSVAATSTSATGTKPASVPNPRRAEIAALFAPATSSRATSSPERVETIAALAAAGRRDLEKETTLKISGETGAWVREGVLRFAWLGEPEETPHYLCSPEGCADESLVSLPNPVLWFDFALGRDDIFLVVTKTGAWLVEADGRGGRNVSLLKTGAGLEARVAAGAIFLRQGGRYWEVEI
jgi:hypothetical protein